MSLLPSPQKILPHRIPFLMVDRITELGDLHVVGKRLFRADEDFFRGHFPGRPIVPAVLLVEAMAQTLGYWALSQPSAPRALLLTGIDRAKFRTPVLPGDEIEIRATIEGMRMGVVRAKVTINMGETLVAQALLKGFATSEA